MNALQLEIDRLKNINRQLMSGPIDLLVTEVKPLTDMLLGKLAYIRANCLESCSLATAHYLDEPIVRRPFDTVCRLGVCDVIADENNKYLQAIIRVGDFWKLEFESVKNSTPLTTAEDILTASAIKLGRAYIPLNAIKSIEVES